VIGLGEPPTNFTGAAICNAVANAICVRAGFAAYGPIKFWLLSGQR